MTNAKKLKIIGLVASGLGLVASVISGWVDKEEMKATIAEQVSEQIQNMLPKE